MNELEAIRARAAERRVPGFNASSAKEQERLLADLDRAIEIAEGTQEAFNLMMDERVNVSTGREKELEKARAAALALRSEVITLLADNEYNAVGQYESRVLADTAWLEEYR